MLALILLRRLGALAALVLLTACAVPPLPAQSTESAGVPRSSLARRYADLLAAEGGRFELEFRLDQLELDDPAQRAALGGGWASALSAEPVAATRSNMLGDAGLQADRWRGAATGRSGGSGAARPTPNPMAGPEHGIDRHHAARPRRTGAAPIGLWRETVLCRRRLAGGARRTGGSV